MAKAHKSSTKGRDLYGVVKDSKINTNRATCSYMNHGGECMIIVEKKTTFNILTRLVEPMPS